MLLSFKNLYSRLRMGFSKILSKSDNREIAQSLVWSYFDSFLWMGMTLVVFKRFGKLPVVNQRFNKLLNYKLFRNVIFKQF